MEVKMKVRASVRKFAVTGVIKRNGSVRVICSAELDTNSVRVKQENRNGVDLARMPGLTYQTTSIS